MEFLYQRKCDFVLHVIIKEFVVSVLNKLFKLKNSKLI